MATLVGGIGTSHAPSIGSAWDKGQQNEPAWAPLFDGYGPARQWLTDIKPDLFLIVYNDHVNRFFFDAYPTFALGVGAVHTGGRDPDDDLPGTCHRIGNVGPDQSVRSSGSGNGDGMHQGDPSWR